MELYYKLPCILGIVVVFAQRLDAVCIRRNSGKINDHHPNPTNDWGDIEQWNSSAIAALCPPADGGTPRIDCADDKGEPIGALAHARAYTASCNLTNGLTCRRNNQTGGHCPDFSVVYTCICPATTTTNAVSLESRLRSTTRYAPLKGPAVQLTTSHSSLKGPAAQFTTRHSSLKGPAAQFMTKHSSLKGPAAQFTTRHSSLKGPAGQFTTRHSSLKGPAAQFTTRHSSLKGPEAQFTTRHSSLKGPAAQFTTRNSSLKGPEAQHHVSDTETISIGTIVGIGVGGVVIFSLAVAGILVYCNSSKKNRRNKVDAVLSV